jgi:hypothetical protein
MMQQPVEASLDLQVGTTFLVLRLHLHYQWNENSNAHSHKHSKLAKQTCTIQANLDRIGSFKMKPK